MALLKVNGIVVLDVTVKENDKILTVITDKLGKISVSAKGAKKINSKLLSSAQLFCYSEMELAEGKNDIYILKDAKLIESFYGLRTDFDKLETAGRIAKLAMRISQPDFQDEALLRTLLNTLYVISKSTVGEKLAEAVFYIRLCHDEGVFDEYSERKSEYTKQAVHYICYAPCEKLFAVSCSDSVTDELLEIGKKAVKVLLDES